MFKKTMIATAAITLASLLAPSSAYAVDTEINGYLVSDVAHELPAPASAMNDEGVSLVAWLGQDPTIPESDPQCDGDAYHCDIVFSLVDPEGTILTVPVAISPTDVDFYFAAPSVTWNPDLQEWVVFMTNYRENEDMAIGVWAQRIAVDGSLIGTAIEMPTNAVTPVDDRSEAAIVTYDDLDDPVQVQGIWSAAEQAYFVSWYAESLTLASDETLNLNSSAAIFGVFLNGDLTVTDGIDAAILLTEGYNTSCCHVGTGYSAENDEWIMGWNEQVSNDYLYVTVSNAAAPVVSEANVIVDSSEIGLADERGYNGGFTWVPEREAWLSVFSYRATSINDNTWGLYGQWISPAGLEGSAFVIDSGEEIFLDAQNANAEVTVDSNRIVRAYVAYDELTGLVHLSYTKQFYNTPDSQDEDIEPDNYRIFGFYTTLDPATELSGEQFVFSSEFPAHTSRPVLDVYSGGVAVVYQDWTNGDWQDPSQVRLAVMSTPTVEPRAEEELAETGFTGGALTGLALASLIAAAGIFALKRRTV